MDIQEQYFQWICRIAMNGKAHRYQRLLRYLFQKDYRYTHPRDGNRESDGIDLRYRFGYLQGIALPEISCELDDKPCSVLEMMVALAIRCEESVMRDFDIGDRTYEWFECMIQTLDIEQDDNIFNEVTVDHAVERFLNREYAPDGAGGLFRLQRPHDDLRCVETWYQAMWWIDEQLNT